MRAGPAELRSSQACFGLVFRRHAGDVVTAFYLAEHNLWVSDSYP